ncbi:DUF4380 domain-containing protein [Xanthomonas graminis pv. phlei]|uniref:DUF4380 domain-containing protein n=2 Tax=Xanthomonas translucens group TaxID=3390202 RepID=A0A0K2ZUH6_9XANT|nr:DUF4380 domain-containing protein [Xanthomonas translucens]UKE65809.1 DUF4380 domain-containing protein [Xanthomonas translucens pv. phlei]UKE73398.1 DUF4380 domain-containing protein [Xanthomonas translucens pv. phleipratensis]CTP89283.1 hypothetical protein XTPLMG730_2420 [Xanthomonas translucens pv. phlei]
MRADKQNVRWQSCALALVLADAGTTGRAATPATPAAADANAPWVMDNGVVRLTVTPTLGGRVLGFQRSGGPNLIKVGDAVQRQPLPTVSAAADDIPYFGHDVWVGPQSAWWQHQHANPARRAAHANWPPDPYLSFATTTVTARAPRRLQLRGVDSPVSGVRLHKTFAVSLQRADSVLLQVQAHNVRKTAVAWDLWFNTRVSSATRVLVPVAAAADIRVQPSDGAGYAPPQYVLQDGLMALAATPPGSAGQRGKLLLQPSAGWIAAFAGGQAWVIRFAHQPRARIHPEQGQVEFYLDAPASDAGGGLLEMEVHAPYRTLAPGQNMQAEEQWTLLDYAGGDDPAQQRSFLCRHAAALALQGACAAP